MRTFFASRHILLLVLLLTFILAPAPVTLATNGSPEGAQEEATAEVTTAPTEALTEIPTEVPMEAPTELPTEVASDPPTAIPTEPPTEPPTATPTAEATVEASPTSEATLDTTPLAEVTAEATLETLLAPVPLVARVEPVTEADLMVARVFVVNSTLDDVDVTPNGICATAGGVCTLRAAIQEANREPEKDTINFNIPGTGPHTIQPATALPVITKPAVINGMTQPGYTWATPQIVLNRSGGIGGFGLELDAGSNGSMIKGLVINGPWASGLFIHSANNLIQGNFIGTNASGTAADGSFIGIEIIGTSATNNLIGGTTAALRNLISGNSLTGVHLSGAGNGNRVQGNYIGTNLTGTASLTIASSGVWVEMTPSPLIGGTVAGARNVISGNGAQGVLISNSSNTLVQGNYIGLTANGSAALGNNGDAVQINGGSGYLIGGTVTGSRNVISGNIGSGVHLIGVTSSVVAGNYLGTDATGTLDRGNVWDGVALNNSTSVTVGGTTVYARNVSSGNTRFGVSIFGGASGNRVQGNFIGTNAAGTDDLGNTLDGAYIENAPNNTIGGTVAGARNVISGNDNNGILITGASASGNRVQGNFIGTNAAGTADKGNSLDGILILQAPSTIIGGTVAGARNVISGNDRHGITIYQAAATLVQGNSIGTNVAGTADLGNLFSGVFNQGSPNTVVGGIVAGAGNRIAYNDSTGIAVTEAGSVNVRLLSNLIYGNGGLGIDLGNNTVTPNDVGDGDPGPNNYQNYPVLQDMRGSRFRGYLDSDNLESYRLQFYASPPTACDPSGHGEGQRYLGTVAVITELSGAAFFNLTLPNVTVTPGWRVSATATDRLGNTSEFASCIVANLGVPALLTPANGAVTPDTILTFDWSDVPHASEYFIQIAYDPGFFVIADFNDSLVTSTYTPPALIAGEVYYWRVASQSGTQTSPWSATRRLDIITS